MVPLLALFFEFYYLPGEHKVRNFPKFVAFLGYVRSLLYKVRQDDGLFFRKVAKSDLCIIFPCTRGPLLAQNKPLVTTVHFLVHFLVQEKPSFSRVDQGII